jgi:hypothetical protein
MKPSSIRIKAHARTCHLPLAASWCCARLGGLSHQTRRAGCGRTFSHLDRLHRPGAKRKFAYMAKTTRRPREWPASKVRRSEPQTWRLRYRYVSAKTLTVSIRKLKSTSERGRAMCNLGRAIGEWSIKQLLLTTSPSLRTKIILSSMQY